MFLSYYTTHTFYTPFLFLQGELSFHIYNTYFFFIILSLLCRILFAKSIMQLADYQLSNVVYSIVEFLALKAVNNRIINCPRYIVL